MSASRLGYPGSAAFAVLLPAVLFVFADQSLLGPFLNPLLLDFFGSTADVVPLGWVGFVFVLLSAVSMIVSGILADRGSRIRVARAGVLLCGAAAAASLLVPHGRTGYVVFFLVRALAGIGAGAVIPAVFSLTADLVRTGRRATAFGALSVAMLVGRLAGFALAAGLDDRWRLAYGIAGAANVLLALVMFLLRDPPRGAQEAELREALLGGSAYNFRISGRDVRLVREARSNLWLILNFVDVIPGSIVLFLIFKYMREVHNLETSAVNVMLLAVFLAGAAGALLFGRIGDWGFERDRRARVVTAMACNTVPIVFMILFLNSRAWAPSGAGLGRVLAAPGIVALILTVAAALFVNQGVNPNWYGTLTDINLPEHRATMISLASVMDLAGNALGPLVASYAATLWGLRTAMAAVLLFWVVNILFWIPVLKHVRRDIEHAHRVLRERAASLRPPL